MSDDPYAERRKLTFEQAEGAVPLPTQLQLKQLTHELRVLLWLVLEQSIELAEYGMNSDWYNILKYNHIFREHKYSDELPDERTLYKNLKNIICNGNYLQVFGFIQFALRHQCCPSSLPEDIDWALSMGRAAYRVLDRSTIIPIVSQTELATLQAAFADLAVVEFHGARSHLRSAGSALTSGDYASSVRESIHAVESVARTLSPSGLLTEALTKLEKSAAIHGALRKGFAAIYGYTSDEKGIRHPLLDDPEAKVDEADALFMIGACAAFVSYMIHKARLAGLLGDGS